MEKKPDIEVFENGKFSLTLFNASLSTGLRKKNTLARNYPAMELLSSLIGKDNILQSLPELTRMSTTEITDAFPYPQIFVLNNLILLCGATKIYELVANAWVLKITVTTGELWQIIDCYTYLYMSNNVVSVIRDSLTNTYSLTSDLPVTNAMCNYNGQVLVGGN